MYPEYKCRFLISLCLFLWIPLSAGCNKEVKNHDFNQEKFVIEFANDKFSVEEGEGYAGSEKCRDCHLEQYKSWEKTRHARSFNTLIFVNKNEDKGCLRCHTTGFGKRSGFKSIEETRGLASVGCESCHGPSLEHLKAGSDRKKETIYQIKDDCKKCEVVKYCIRCHNLIRDPVFVLKKDLKTIAH